MSEAVAYSSGPNLRTSNLKSAGECGTVVEQMSQLPKVEGSSPGRVGGTRGRSHKTILEYIYSHCFVS